MKNLLLFLFYCFVLSFLIYCRHTIDNYVKTGSKTQQAADSVAIRLMEQETMLENMRVTMAKEIWLINGEMEKELTLYEKALNDNEKEDRFNQITQKIAYLAHERQRLITEYQKRFGDDFYETFKQF